MTWYEFGEKLGFIIAECCADLINKAQRDSILADKEIKEFFKEIGDEIQRNG